MADPTDAELRESARHRGLKLVKSRRRKPGGDFGLYGLTEADGRPRLGIGEGRLTATAAEVADYLRKGDAATWASSVEATPDPPPASKRKPEPQPIPTPAPHRPPRTPPTRARAAPPPTPPPPPKPELRIRPATRADAGAIAALVPNSDKAIIAERLAAATALGEPVYVADQDGVIGCLAWHVVPTLQHGPVARLTFLAVAVPYQRRGVGRGLVDQLIQAAAARDLSLLEAVSDIALENSHGFFRRLGFAQSSYRFTRSVEPDR